MVVVVVGVLVILGVAVLLLVSGVDVGGCGGCVCDSGGRGFGVS